LPNNTLLGWVPLLQLMFAMRDHRLLPNEVIPKECMSCPGPSRVHKCSTIAARCRRCRYVEPLGDGKLITNTSLSPCYCFGRWGALPVCRQSRPGRQAREETPFVQSAHGHTVLAAPELWLWFVWRQHPRNVSPPPAFPPGYNPASFIAYPSLPLVWRERFAFSAASFRQ